MPSADCDGFTNLVELNRLGHIAKEYLRDTTGILNPGEVEKLVFGSANYLYNNIFVTSHQTANVYTKPAAHYEVRCDDKSIDIQVDETVGLRPSEMKSRVLPIGPTLLEEKNITPQKLSKKVPEFKIVVLGEYRVGIVGKVNPIIEILRKLGGTPSDNVIYKGHMLGQGYSIMKYNMPRLLQLLEEDGWNIGNIKENL